MTETKFGTFAELLEITPDTLKPISVRLKEIILDIDPDAVEVVRLGDRAATYGVGPRKMKEGYTYILPHKKWINLGFFQGFTLPDPTNLLEGTGAKMRHVKIRSLEDAERPEIQALIKASIAERKKALSL